MHSQSMDGVSCLPIISYLRGGQSSAVGQFAFLPRRRIWIMRVPVPQYWSGFLLRDRSQTSDRIRMWRQEEQQQHQQHQRMEPKEISQLVSQMLVGPFRGKETSQVNNAPDSEWWWSTTTRRTVALVAVDQITHVCTYYSR